MQRAICTGCFFGITEEARTVRGTVKDIVNVVDAGDDEARKRGECWKRWEEAKGQD